MEQENQTLALQPDVPVKLPTMALRGLVIFPGMTLQFDVGRKKSILALANAMEENQLVFLVTQKDLEEGDPTEKDLYKMGVIL